jgi:hypothetical protein
MRMCTAPLPLLLALTIGCGGGSSTMTSSSEVSGAYEFVVTSNVTGSTTLVEVNLTAKGSQSSATGPSQAQILSLEKKVWYVNGVCTGETPGENAVTTTVSGDNVALAFNIGGNSFNGQGVLTGNAISGNYSVSDSKCPDLVGIIGVPPGTDSGGIVGNQVPALAGTFSGSLNLGDGTDNAALTLVESSDQTLAVIAALSGPADNGSFPFSGSAVGNLMFVKGSVNGRATSLFGYFDRTGQFTGFPNSMMVFNYQTQATAGLLIKQ